MTSAPSSRHRAPLAAGRLVTLISLVALTAMGLACGDDGGVPVNLGEPLYDAEYPAGVELRDHTYTVPGLGTERSLLMNMWYPTTDTEGEGTRFGVIWRDAISFRDATVDVPARPAPLLVYSHGHVADGGSNFRLARQFVQNGWIVIAPDHTGNTLQDNIDPRPFEFDALRVHDIQATIDFAANLPEGHPLRGKIDTSRVLVAGHSYGAFTSWLLGGPTLDLAAIEAGCAPDCVEAELDAYRTISFDSRIAGIVALDGSVGTDRVADSGFAAMTIPAMLLSSDDRGGTQELFDRAAGIEFTWFEFQNACHESFTGSLICNNGFPLDESLRATARLTIAFGQQVVLGDTSAEVADLLSGATEVHPDIVRSYRSE